MKKIFLVFLAVFCVSQIFAQTAREVSGVVRDTSGMSIIGAMVKLAPIGSSGDTLSTRTSIDGVFVFKGVKASQFTLIFSSLGYQAVRIRSVNAEGLTPIILGAPVIMRSNAIALNQVVVSGATPVVIKQDTIEYDASVFKLKENAVAEDLIKRLDGVEVDRDGNVTSQGKAVTRVRVNGKDYFGGDVKTATKNIPVKAISKVQLVNDYGDQANFTGLRDGEPETIINIVTKPGITKGIIANATAGVGTEGRYQFSAFGNQLEKERNIGFTANLNNNGTQVGGFGFGGRGGPSAVTMVNASGGSGSFGAGSGGTAIGLSGITLLGSAGLTYSDRWNKKLVVTGGYYFYNTDNSTISTIIGENVTARGTIFGLTYSDRGTNSHAHSMNARIEYTISPNDMMVISPSVGFTTGSSDLGRNNFQTGITVQDQQTTTRNKIYTPSIGGNALYTHKFAKAGRNYSLNVGGRTNGVDSDDDNLNNIRYYNPTNTALEKDSIERRINMIDNQTLLTAVRFIYSEPLSKTGSLQFSYNMNYNHYDNARMTSRENSLGTLVAIDSLSNMFDYSFISHQVGANYSYRSPNDELALGLTANPATLSGNSTIGPPVSRTNFYLAPILRYTHRFSRTKNIQANYTSRASEPTFTQLQPVRDVSDPQRQVVGNSNLNSSFSHSVTANYNTSNPDKNTSFLLRFQGSLTSDRIVTNTLLIPDVYSSFKREIRFQNADGTHSYSGNYNWQKSFGDRQYTVRLNGNAGYAKNVSFADNVRNLAGEWSARQGAGLQINPGTWLELSPNVSYRYANIAYTLPTSTDIKIHTYTIDVDGNLFFLKNRSLIWRFIGIKSFNSGYSGLLNVNTFVLNTSVEKAFLKDRSATLRLLAFDVFNQANNVYRNLTDNGFADIRTNRLTQYFMMTLTMRLNKLGIGEAAAEQPTAKGRSTVPAGR